MIAIDLKAKKEVGQKAILVWGGNPCPNAKIDIGEDCICLCDKNCSFILFENDRGLAHGLHIPIKEIEKKFEEFEIYVPYKTSK